MIISDGKNNFPDHEFSFWEWSAPILQTPEEVMQMVHKLKLMGRVVKDIIAVGMGYNWREDRIEDAVYDAIERMDPEMKAQIPDPDAYLPKGVELPCCAEIDEPLLIVFEDGDTLGIDYSEGSSVRMELNTIPNDIDPGTNMKTFHASRLFRDMIGKQIAAVEVTGSTECLDFTGSHGLELEDQPSYIRKVDIVYNDGPHDWARKRLSFTSWFDYGWVEIVDDTGKTISVPTEKVPWIVEGYIDPEVLEGN